jgi:hypothetical protein
LLPLIAAVLSLPLNSLGETTPTRPGALRILSDRTLPPALFLTAIDVRWASDRSVYLPAGRKGTFEVPLEENGKVKEMIPGEGKTGGFFFANRVAVSSQYLVVGSPVYAVTWRKLTQPARSEEAFDNVEDLDVFEDRLLVLGARRDDQGNYAPEGAIAWLGSLSKGLSDLRPVLYDRAGPGAKTFGSCLNFEIGAVRFLRDGSFLVVPGVQPGAHLYNAAGKLVRTWDTGALGLDTDCSSLRHEQARRLAVDPAARFDWVNQRRILEDILPLPQGPGLIVRKVVQGQIRWELKILSDEIATYEIPVPSERPLAHLRGDVRGNKIALLVYERDRSGFTKIAPRLLVAEMPQR